MLKDKGNIKNIKRVIIAVGITAIIVLLGIRIFNGFKILNNVSADHPVQRHSILLVENNLVSKKYHDKLEAGEVYQSNNKSLIALSTFDGKYYLISYKINLIKDTLLSNVLHMVLKSVEPTTMEPYTSINENLSFKFNYREAPKISVRQVYLTLSGDSLKNIVNCDSIVSYYFLCNNFSIKYTENEPIDIFVVGRDKPFGVTTVIPMDLLFLKRDGAVYLMMMTPNNSHSTIQPDLLYNIVTGR